MMDWNSKEFNTRSKIHFFDIIRMHWDMSKGPIVNGNDDENIVSTYSWFDGRCVNLTQEERKKKFEMYPFAPEYIEGSREYLESLSRAESDINPLYYSGEMAYLKLPKIRSGVCMDQFGNLFKFKHKDDFYETAILDHIACSCQSPLHKYDGDSFLEENVLRRIPPVIIDGKEFFDIKSLPDKQKKVFQSLYGEKFYGVKLIHYSEYTLWHYYWYQDERKIVRDEKYKRLGI
jgi:hypothetical protein